MPRDLQTSLLRAIETRTIVRVGGQRAILADVRIIAATHKDLREEARLGNFRFDLYYRLNVLTIEIPSLRQRAEDVPLLVQHFLQRQSSILGRSLAITPEALSALKEYYWPGNVRELENMLERVTYLASKPVITSDDLPLELQKSFTDLPALSEEEKPQATTPAAGNKMLKDHSMHAEVQAITQAWQSSHGNITRAASLLGISRTTMWRKMVKYGLDKNPVTSKN